MWWGNGWMTQGAMPWMFFGPVMMLIFFAACIAVLFLIARGLGRTSAADGALGILKERFARGEIDQAEFEQRRRILLAD